MLHQYSKNLMIEPPTAATSANLTSDHIDMQGFDGVEITALIGDSTGTAVTMALLGGNTTATQNALYTYGSTVAISVASTAVDNKQLVVDVYRPPTRYLSVTLTNATTKDILYGGILARKYNARSLPVTASTTAELAAAKVFAVQPTTTPTPST
jgi:hypothetical protein